MGLWQRTRLPGLTPSPSVDQQWSMFSPQPAVWSRFLALRSETAAGRTVDLLTDGPGGAADTMLPPAGWFAADRWRTYLRHVRRQPAESQQRLGERLALYLARQWNAAHVPEDRVERVRLYRVDAPIRLAGDVEPDGRRTRVRSAARNCSPADARRSIASNGRRRRSPQQGGISAPRRWSACT